MEALTLAAAEGVKSADTVATVNPARLVSAVRNIELAMNSSITLRLFSGEQGHDARTAEQLKVVLGEEGPRLVEQFVNAKNEMTRALLESCNVTRKAMLDELRILLVAGAVSTDGDRYTLHDYDGGVVSAKVVAINSARHQPDGAVWGFLHVSPSDNIFESWEFTWRDDVLKVRSRDDVY